MGEALAESGLRRGPRHDLPILADHLGDAIVELRRASRSSARSAPPWPVAPAIRAPRRPLA